MSICATVGIPVVTGIDACIHDGFVGFTNLRGVDRNFLYYKLKELEPAFVALGQSGTQVNLNSDLVRDYLIPLPPLDEQRAIAEALSDVDALIAALDALIAKKRAVKTAAMQQLLTGRQRLPGFSGEWEVRTLADMATLGGGMSASRADLSITGHRYLHYGDIHVTDRTHAHVHEHYDARPRLDIPLTRAKRSALLETGDVAFVDASEDEEGASRYVVIDNPTKTPFISGLHTIVAKGLAAYFDPMYMRYAFQAPSVKNQFRFYAAGTKVMGVSKSNMGKIEVSIPERAEQHAIARILSDMDAEIAALEARRDKTRHIKTGMMQELLTGRTRLVQPAIVQPKARERPTRPAKDRGHNWAIDEAVVLGSLAHRFGSPDWPLARVRRTKLTYLFRRHAGQAPKGFLKQAAGPYNPRARYGGPEKIAKQNGYVRETDNGRYAGFVAAANVEKALGYFDTWYGPDALDWLEQFRRLKTDDLGVLTTVDYAALELRRAGKDVTVETVKAVLAADTNWAPKLTQAAFTDEKIKAAIQTSTALFGTSLPDED